MTPLGNAADGLLIEFGRHGGDVERYAPASVCAALRRKYEERAESAE